MLNWIDFLNAGIILTGLVFGYSVGGKQNFGVELQLFQRNELLVYHLKL